MKIIQNLANVFGLTFGGFLLAAFGFEGFFLVFGALLITLAIYSIISRNQFSDV